MDRRAMVKGAAAVVLLTVASLLVTDSYTLSLIAWISIAALIASSMRFVTLIGELNFATAAFVGIGAYASGLTLTMMDWPFFPALLLSGFVAAAAGFAFGYVTLKTKGPFFLLIGFAFTEMMRLIYTKSDLLGSNSGMVGIFAPEYFGDRFPSFVVAAVGLMILLLYAIEQSDMGKTFVGIRDNDQVALAVGIRVHLNKTLCLTIGAFAAGVAGGLMGFVNNVISPADFSFLLSTFALAYLKVGGEDQPLGPVAGAIILVILSTIALNFGGEDHIFYGTAIVLSVLLMPKGLMGLLDRLRSNHAREDNAS